MKYLNKFYFPYCLRLFAYYTFSLWVTRGGQLTRVFPESIVVSQLGLQRGYNFILFQNVNFILCEVVLKISVKKILLISIDFFF